MIRSRLHLLQAGLSRHPEAMAMRGASLCPVDFPALAALILHPTAGPLLWDTGYDPAFFAATRPMPERLYRWTTPVTLAEDQPVSRQITRFGLAPSDIQGVILSHFHGDHIAGLPAFPHARLYCSRAGLAQIRNVGRFGGVRRGLIPALTPPDAERRAHYFEDRPAAPLPPDLSPFDVGADLLGDGSLLAVELPGHCVGHWGLALRDEAGDRTTFLIGDAAWSRRAVREDRPPPAITTALLGRTGLYRRTLTDLRPLAGRTDTVRLIPSHCREAAAEVEPA